MTSLWLYITLFIIFALLFLVVPVVRFRQQESVLEHDEKSLRKQKNVELFEQRKAELAEELANKVIESEAFETLNTELQRTFLKDMDDLESAPVRKTSNALNKLLPLSFAVLIPVFSFLIYQGWGSGKDIVLPELLAQVSGAESEAQQVQALNDLAEFLQQRFERREDDIQNGYMLGTLYLELDQYTEAGTVFQSMIDQMEDNLDKATVYGQLAQSQYMAAGSQMTEAVRATTDLALGLNPNEYAVMSILAIDAFLAEDFAGAISYWRRQLLQANAGSREEAVLRDRIAQVQTLLPELAQGDEAAVGGASVTLVVDIAPAFLAQLDEARSLFIYIRNPIMPAPIVAQNLPIPEFPFSITLTDADSMMGISLASAETLIAGARVSFTGQAIAAPGDFQIVSAPFVLVDQTDSISLIISDIVPQ